MTTARTLTGLGTLLLLGLLAVAAPPPKAKKAGKAAEKVEPYLRVAQSGDVYQLEIALRRFERPSGGPSVWLSGVVHIGDADYYKRLQEHLDAQKLVLFEAVGGPDRLPDDPSEDERQAWTESSLHTLAYIIEQHKHRHGSYPPSLALMRQAAGQGSSLMAAYIRVGMVDGWGRGVSYARRADGYVLRSGGRDGQAGGDHAEDDVEVTGPIEVSRDGDHALYTSMATGLNLTFQLDAINYDRAHFVNSDLTVNGLRLMLDDRESGDEKLDEIMAMLDGTSLTGKFMQVMFNIVGASPKLREIVRLMIVDMLGQLTGDLGESNLLGDKELMRRLITDRNKIVIGDLRRVLARADAPETVSVFYGAGHMVDMEQRVRRLGYRPAETVWLAAITAEPKKAGISDELTQSLRVMIKAQLEELKRQMAAKAAKGKKKR